MYNNATFQRSAIVLYSILFPKTKRKNGMSHKSDGAPEFKRKEISLSIEETNRLRISLGLRPLRERSPPPRRQRREKPLPKPKENGPSIQERIEKSRSKRAQNSFVAKRRLSLADIDNDDESGDDAAVWVEQMRNRKNKVPAKPKQSNKAAATEKSAPEQYTSQHLSGLKVAHDEEVLGEQEGTILTLKDKDVLNADEENDDTVDVLESVEIVYSGKRKRTTDPHARYDVTDSAEFSQNGSRAGWHQVGDERNSKKAMYIGSDGVAVVSGNHQLDAQAKDAKIAEQLSLSITLDEKPKFEEDYELSRKQERVLSRKRKSRHKSKKRKRRMANEVDDLHNGVDEVIDFTTRKPLSRVAAIRSKAAQEIIGNDNDDDDDDDDDQLHKSLRRARENARNAGVDASVQRILKIIDEAEENVNGEDDGGGLSANMIFNEMEQYVRNITVDHTDAIESGDDDGRGASKSLDHKAEEIEEDKSEAHNPGAATIETVVSSEISPTGEENPTAEMGVAAALARFRTMGDLNGRRKQQGRAKDKQLDWEDLNSQVQVPAGQRSVQLMYTDEKGNQLTPKEAFRLMCHKFHGKGPSKNKREVRLRRELQKMRQLQMAHDDTPLGSTSVLRKETKRTGVAYVVLSGSSVAPDQSALDGKSLAKGSK